MVLGARWLLNEGAKGAILNWKARAAISAVFSLGVVGVLGLGPKSSLKGENSVSAPQSKKSENRPAEASDDFFRKISAELKEKATGVAVAVIDLDRLDANIDAVRNRVRPPFRLRIVEKSLPSLELLDQVLSRAQTNRLMAFHAQRVPQILKYFKAKTGRDCSLDILFGKPIPVRSAEALLVEHPESHLCVTWLIDSNRRLQDYLILARRLELPLQLSLEIDVGIRRGGFDQIKDFEEALRVIQRESELLHFAGLMGYDGHVPKTPSFLGWGGLDAHRRTLKRVVLSYRDFYAKAREVLNPQVSTWDHLVFNSGGSRTYALYEAIGDFKPINDLALGSGFVMPSDFSDDTLSAHQPALWLASPILKKLKTRPLPFLEPVWGLISRLLPQVEQGYVLYGGGYFSKMVAPSTVRPSWFYGLDGKNILSNQTLVNSRADAGLEEGDFVFFEPREGDALSLFQTIYCVRAGRIVDQWKPFQVLN